MELSSSPTTTPMPLRAFVWQTQAPRPLHWWWQYNSTAAAAAPSTTSTMMQQQMQKVVLEQFVHAYSWQPVATAPSSHVLQQGDTLVAVNGQVMAGPCKDFDAVLQMFQTSQRLCMLVIRPSSSPSLSGSSSCHQTKSALATKSTTTAKKTSRAAVASSTAASGKTAQFVLFRNPLFCDPSDPSLGLPFADDLEFDIDDGKRAKLFLKPIGNVTTWIQERKRKWRTTYTVPASTNDESSDKGVPTEDQHVAVDFWTRQGFVDLEDWIRKRKGQWRQHYSWQRAKRQHARDKDRRWTTTPESLKTGGSVPGSGFRFCASPVNVY